MRQVDQVIRERLASQVVLINQIANYIIGAGGKRIRPRLVLLFAKALGYQGSAHYEMAAVVEFIHTATLLHDDVVDESALRRGRATANAMFGNAASVLVGDFLYSRSFQMMVSVNEMRVLDVLADATNVTAKLFEASARLGAILGGADAAVEEACADYGRSLGTCFQLVDDLLDYEGNSDELGKNAGDDLREGKATLPLLIAMARGTPEQRAEVRQAIELGEVDKLAQIVDIVRSSGAIQATREAALAEAEKAQACLSLLPDTPARQALAELSIQSVRRSS